MFPRRLHGDEGLPMKLLLIDDHALFRAGMQHMLARLSVPVSVLEAPDIESGAAIAPHHPDLALVLIDLSMPGISGLPGVMSFRGRFPKLPVVVLSASEEPQAIASAMRAGVVGFIPKSSTPNVMLAALDIVLKGGRYLPPQALGLEGSPGRAGDGAGVREPDGPDHDPTAERMPAVASGGLQSRLTPRQLEVLALLVQGMPNKKIARCLGIEPSTIKMHLTVIFGALRVANRTQAVAAVYRLGLKLPDVSALADLATSADAD
jgi:two-component system, NarL family, nitrate/nitrite response regulator NarL